MYTVLRFKDIAKRDIDSLGEQIEKAIPGTFDGEELGCAHRVSISLAFDGNWMQHQDVMKTRLMLLDPIMSQFYSKNQLGIDVAIEPNDFRSIMTELVFEHDLLEFIVSRRIEFKISFYQPMQT